MTRIDGKERTKKKGKVVNSDLLSDTQMNN